MVRRNGGVTARAAVSSEMPFIFCQSGFSMKRTLISGGINRLTAAVRRALSNPTTALIIFIPASARALIEDQTSGRPPTEPIGFKNASLEPRSRVPNPAIRITASVNGLRIEDDVDLGGVLICRNISLDPRSERAAGASER